MRKIRIGGSSRSPRGFHEEFGRARNDGNRLVARFLLGRRVWLQSSLPEIIVLDAQSGEAFAVENAAICKMRPDIIALRRELHLGGFYVADFTLLQTRQTIRISACALAGFFGSF